MLDPDYSYFTARLVAEQNRARIAACPEAAVAHRKLADAYLGRLQSMISWRETRTRSVFSIPRTPLQDAAQGEGGVIANLNTRSRDGRRGNPL